MKSRIVIASLASAYFIYYALTPAEDHFINVIDLVIHEAGHIVFMFFGQFMHILGGSLFQIIVPILFVIYFYRQKEYYSASLLLFWVGQNVINVSVYAADAVRMQLPLLGGDSVGHDWHAILSMTGTLAHTNAIGNTIFAIGVAVILTAGYYSFYFSTARHVSD